MVDVKSDPFNPKLDKVAAFKLYFSFSLFFPSDHRAVGDLYFLLFFLTHFYSQIIEPWEMHALGVGTPHTTHCLADGNVMISTLSDGPKKNGKGNFILLDGETFKPKSLWVEDKKDEGEFG